MDTAAAVQMEGAAVRARRRPRAGAERFSQFYALHYRDVTGLAYTLTGSWAAAEDIAQEAFLRAYRDWRRLERFQRPDSWVRTVAVNLATSRGRRLAAETRALARLRGRRGTEEEGGLPDEAEAFWSAVRRLPRRQAQAVALRYHSDLSVREVAAVMGCAEGTAKAHLHAARQALAAVLGLEEGEA
jgi:RNA polymerase sigma factor (sigma-70 family)